MVTVAEPVAAAWELLHQVPDPELPVLDVVELGIVRDVEVRDGGRTVRVDITPTYSGCPAMRAIEDDVARALGARFGTVEVRVVLDPPWTTDWLGAEARRKLADHGIAPPERAELAAGRRLLPLSVTGGSPGGLAGRPRQCPRCGARDLTLVSQFGSTACKAMWRCDACAEPFDYFKAH